MTRKKLPHYYQHVMNLNEEQLKNYLCVKEQVRQSSDACRKARNEWMELLRPSKEFAHEPGIMSMQDAYRIVKNARRKRFQARKKHNSAIRDYYRFIENLVGEAAKSPYVGALVGSGNDCNK